MKSQKALKKQFADSVRTGRLDKMTLKSQLSGFVSGAWFVFISFCSSPLVAETIEMKDGSKVEGRIVEQTDREIVVETMPGMNTEILRKDIREIKGAPKKNEAGTSQVAGNSPAPAATARNESGIPQPTIITKPGFKTEGTWGGLSDGATLGIDGKLLADHKLYSIDTYYFIEKVQNGFSNQVASGDKYRVDQLRSIVITEGFIRNLIDDLASGVTLLKDSEKTIESKKKDLDRENQSYEQRHETKPEAIAEHSFLTLVSQLEGAKRAYELAEGYVNYEEQTKVKDRIKLEDNPSPRGKKLRERMKESVQKMADFRAQITSQFGNYLEAGRLKEEDAGGREVYYTVKSEKALLFPYQGIEGPADQTVRDGLWEDHKGAKITEAKPVILPKGEKVEFLESKTLEINHSAKGNQPVTLEVHRVKIKSDKIVDLKTNHKLSMIIMEGWVLADRLQKVEK